VKESGGGLELCNLRNDKFISLFAGRTIARAGASQCYRSICLKMMATSDFIQVITFTNFMTFTQAIESASSLNPFSESLFRNGNASLDIFPRTPHFAHFDAQIGAMRCPWG
jgi:hypothetical protein